MCTSECVSTRSAILAGAFEPIKPYKEDTPGSDQPYTFGLKPLTCSLVEDTILTFKYAHRTLREIVGVKQCD